MRASHNEAAHLAQIRAPSLNRSQSGLAPVDTSRKLRVVGHVVRVGKPGPIEQV